MESFRQGITPNFTQWINGSFTTTNPNDIDLVTLIDHEVLAKNSVCLHKNCSIMMN